MVNEVPDINGFWNRQQPDTQQLLAPLRLLGRNDPSRAEEATAAA